MNLKELYQVLDALDVDSWDRDLIDLEVNVDGDWWAPIDKVVLEENTLRICISVNRSES